MNSIHAKEFIHLGENWNLSQIEVVLRTMLKQCDLWAELSLTGDESALIRSRLSEQVDRESAVKSIKKLIKDYPVVVMTDFVYFFIHEYSHEKIWELWGEGLGINFTPQQQSQVGSELLKILKEFGFPTESDGGFTYIAPIQIQAGIPNVSLRRLYDVLDGPIESGNFEPLEFINELVSFKKYAVDQSVIRFFKRYPEKAEELLLQLAEMFRFLGRKPSEYDQTAVKQTGLNERFVEQYYLWREETRSNYNNRKKQTQYFIKPRIVFDEVKGVSLSVPQQTIYDPYCNTLQWTVYYAEESKTEDYYASVFESETNYSQSLLIPLRPCSVCKVDVVDADNPIKALIDSWTFTLLESDRMLMFDHRGEMQKEKSLNDKGNVFVYPKKRMQEVEYINMQPPIAVDPFDHWETFEFHKTYPVSQESTIRVHATDGPKLIECTSKITIDFIEKDTLFGTRFVHNPIPAFFKPPSLILDYGSSRLQWEKLQGMAIQLFHPLSSFKKTLGSNDLTVKDDGRCMVVSLHPFFDTTPTLYGRYEIKISYQGHRKNSSFYVTPFIKAWERCENELDATQNPYQAAATLFYEKDASYHVTFDNEVETEQEYQKTNHVEKVTLMNPEAFLTGKVRISIGEFEVKIPFKKELRLFEWSFHPQNQTKNATYEKKMGHSILYPKKHDIAWRLTMQFCRAHISSKRYYLILEHEDKTILQEKEVYFDKKGLNMTDLMTFRERVMHGTLPMHLKLGIEEKNGYNEYLDLMTFEEYVEIKNPVYISQQNKDYLAWERGVDLRNRKLALTPIVSSTMAHYAFNFQDYTVMNVELGKEKLKYQAITLKEPVTEGSYLIEPKLSKEKPSLFKKKEDTFKFNVHKMVVVGNPSKLMERYPTDTLTFMEAITLLSMGLQSDKKCAHVTDFVDEKKIGTFLDTEINCKAFVNLIRALSHPELSDSIKHRVGASLEKVIDQAVTKHVRSKLLIKLIEAGLKKHEMELVSEKLQLHTFEPDYLMADLTMAMWNTHKELAVLMILRKTKEVTPMEAQKLIGFLGMDFFESLFVNLTATASNSSDVQNRTYEALNGVVDEDITQKLISKDLWGDGTHYAAYIQEIYENKRRKKNTTVEKDPYQPMETFMDNTYTELVKKWFETPNQGARNSFDAQQLIKIEQAMARFQDLYPERYQLADNRLNGGLTSESHRAFRLSAWISLIWTTEEKETLRRMTDVMLFWNAFFKQNSKLAYRDLILSELLTKIQRGDDYVNESY